jgi:hypothetical protein
MDLAYRETDPLGGYDPYSSSKACAEIVSAAYRQSYFPTANLAEHGVALATARAGNVIGGGDWSPDRLIPDLIRGFLAGEPVRIRRPHAIRPWQHVLEPLRGYILLAEHLLTRNPAPYATAYNFGPSRRRRPARLLDIADKMTASGATTPLGSTTPQPPAPTKPATSSSMPPAPTPTSAGPRLASKPPSTGSSSGTAPGSPAPTCTPSPSPRSPPTNPSYKYPATNRVPHVSPLRHGKSGHKGRGAPSIALLRWVGRKKPGAPSIASETWEVGPQRTATPHLPRKLITPMPRPHILLTLLLTTQLLAQSTTPTPTTIPALFLSDIHLDPYADPAKVVRLNAAPIAQWPAILAAPPSPTQQQDSAALQPGLPHPRRRHPQRSLAVQPPRHPRQRRRPPLRHRQRRPPRPLLRLQIQDPPARRHPRRLPRLHRKDRIRYVVSGLRESLPGVPIYVALGNNDSGCTDYQLDPRTTNSSPASPPSSPKPSRPISAGRPHLRPARLRHRRLLQRPARGVPHTRLIVLDDIFLSAKYATCSGKPDPAPAAAQLAWLDAQLAAARQHNERVWVMGHIPPGVDLYATAASSPTLRRRQAADVPRLRTPRRGPRRQPRHRPPRPLRPHPLRRDAPAHARSPSGCPTTRACRRVSIPEMWAKGVPVKVVASITPSTATAPPSPSPPSIPPPQRWSTTPSSWPPTHRHRHHLVARVHLLHRLPPAGLRRSLPSPASSPASRPTPPPNPPPARPTSQLLPWRSSSAIAPVRVAAVHLLHGPRLRPELYRLRLRSRE